MNATTSFARCTLPNSLVRHTGDREGIVSPLSRRNARVMKNLNVFLDRETRLTEMYSKD